MNKLNELHTARKAAATQRAEYEDELRQVTAELDAMDRVITGSRQHERMQQLEKRQRQLLNWTETLERETAQLDRDIADEVTRRDRDVAHLRKLEAAIAPGGDLPTRLAAAEAEVKTLRGTIEEYKAVTIPRQRKRLIEQYGWPDHAD